MELGRYIDGRILTYDQGTATFAVGEAPVSADDVRAFSAAGSIIWSSPDVARWFHDSFPPRKEEKKSGAVIAIVVACVLAVFILVCGILTAIAVPVFSSAKTSAQRKACYANERTVEGAAQIYKIDNNGAVPDSMAVLVPKYIKTSPTCLVGGTYTYDPAAMSATCSVHGHF